MKHIIMVFCLDLFRRWWCPYTKKNIVNLEQNQRKATRLILGKTFPEHELLHKLSFLPLQYRREILIY